MKCQSEWDCREKEGPRKGKRTIATSECEGCDDMFCSFHVMAHNCPRTKGGDSESEVRKDTLDELTEHDIDDQFKPKKKSRKKVRTDEVVRIKRAPVHRMRSSSDASRKRRHRRNVG